MHNVTWYLYPYYDIKNAELYKHIIKPTCFGAYIIFPEQINNMITAGVGVTLTVGIGITNSYPCYEGMIITLFFWVPFQYKEHLSRYKDKTDSIFIMGIPESVILKRPSVSL